VESIISGTLTTLTSFEERLDVGDLVAVGILQADVDHLRAAAHLRAADLGGGLEVALGDQRLKRREPSTLVRSPTSSGRLSSVSSTASTPETNERLVVRRRPRPAAGDERGERRDVRAVVPQQPPTRLSQPASRKRAKTAAKTSGVSR
jgi:hypothetical protein